MSLNRANERVAEVAQAQVDAGREVGMQVVAYLGGRRFVDVCVGLADPDAHTPVRPDTLFNVYSVSKAITVTALHMQVDRGRLDYDDLVVRHWPEYGVAGKAATTVRDVITHRAGVPQMPEGVTPADLGDWDAMTRRIAALEPLAPPGSKSMYQAMTFGWLVGELVRRTDPQRRPIDRYIREEIAEPLAAPDLWFGVPDGEAHRIARHRDDTPPTERPPLSLAALPPAVALTPRIFDRPEVRRAVLPAVGGVFTADSCARFWAMLAQGGELDGVRLLSQERVATFNTPRSADPDLVMYGHVLPLSSAGFWLGGPEPSVRCARNRKVICHPGAGNTIAWAALDERLAVAVCHNRMYPTPVDEDEDAVWAVAREIWRLAEGNG